MSETNKKRCMVLLPSGPHFERLFDEVLQHPINQTGLVPTRLYWNAISPTPIHIFIDQIEQAEALVADVSEHTNEIWFAVGCAVALGKPLCLISSAVQSNLSLGIQHLPHISYPVDASPNDYIELQHTISAQLSAVMPHANTTQPEPRLHAPLPSPSPTSESSDDLSSYEVIAMTILNLRACKTGLSPRDLGLEMKACNAAPLTSHAMNALKRRRFIEIQPVQISEGNELYLSENLFITRAGEDWLSRHGKRATPQHTPIRSRARFVSTR
jgi:hypothetical protein